MSQAEVVQLRPATPGDWGAIEQVLMHENLPVAGAREHLGDFIVATSGDIVGCIAVERYGEGGLLRSLAVTSSHRNLQIGHRLVEACIAHARATGVKTLVLLTETAEEYFARRGFRRVERSLLPSSVRASAEFRGACPESAVAMMREI